LSILQNNPGITNHLIESGADVNAQTKYGDTPLATAVRTGNSEAVKLLLNNGANPNFKDSGNFTLLHNATNHNKLEILGLLLEAGANPNIQMRTFAYTPLHLACKNGDLKSVELLLKYGADPKIKDSDGRTALQLANNTITSKLIEDKIIVGSNQATRNPNTNQQQIQTTEVIQNNNINGDNPPAYSQRENNTVSIEDTLPPYSSLPPAYSLNDPRISKLNETKAEKPNCP
jgi:ankyrin repeat protein